eukprot:154060_1
MADNYADSLEHDSGETQTESFPQITWWLRAYVCCLCLRVIFAFTPGYIHADEFFQSQEIMARDLFGFSVFTPWEFQGDGHGGQLPTVSGHVPTAYRSVVTPAVSSGLPYLGLKWAADMTNSVGSSPLVNSFTIFVLPRLSVLFHSGLVDWLIFRICKRTGIRTAPVMLTLCSSWPVVLFHSRPFSNTYESFLLCILIFVLTRSRARVNPNRARTLFTRNFVFGAVVALGVFTRFTFLAFAFPLGLFLLYDNFVLTKLGSRSMLRLFTQLVSWCLAVLSGIIVTGTLCALADSMYFGTLQLDSRIGSDGWIGETFKGLLKGRPRLFTGSLTLTPLNNLIYNMDVNNLANWGLHPRWLHVLVNLPMLFGPLYLLCFFKLPSLGLSGLEKDIFVKKTEVSRPINFPTRRAFLVSLCGVIACGVLALSLAPHQEARFLLPLCLPMALLGGALLFSGSEKSLGALARKPKIIIWVVFNLAMAIFFGVLHQGGVIQTVMRLQTYVDANSQSNTASVSSQTAPTQVIFFKTYMPPHCFAARPPYAPHGDSESQLQFEINDFGIDSTFIDFHQKFSDLKNSQKDSNFAVILVVPSSVNVEHLNSGPKRDGGNMCFDFNLLDLNRPHLSTEDPPQSIDQMSLAVYGIYTNDC